jgi:hypothetical protein
LPTACTGPILERKGGGAGSLSAGDAPVRVVHARSGSPRDAGLRLTHNASHASGSQEHAMGISDGWPRDQSPTSKHNGHLHHGTPPHQGQACGHQGVDGFAQALVAEGTRGRPERGLVERISVRAICRAVGVTRPW